MYALMLTTLLLAASGAPPPPDNAGIFFYGQPPSATALAAALKGAAITTTHKGALTVVTAKWPDVSLEITINPDWNRSAQLSGIRGWLGRLPATETDTAAVKSFLSRLDQVTTCYGSVMRPKYDNPGKAANALLQILRAGGGGFLFSHQSFYDQSGSRIVGLPGDPTSLVRH